MSLQASSSISLEELHAARARVLPLVRRLEFREQALLQPLQTLLSTYELVSASTGSHDAAVYVAAKEARRHINAESVRAEFTYPDAPGKLGRGSDWTPGTLATYCEQSAKKARARVPFSAPEHFTIEARTYRLRDSAPTFQTLPPLIGLSKERNTLEAHLRNLFMYNPATQTNELIGSFPAGITLAGPPGTGKSSLLSHVVSIAAELSAVSYTPHTLATYDASQFSSYFGRSTRILKQLVERTRDPRGVGILIMEDADMIFQNRADTQVSRGVLEVQQYLMNTLSGLNQSKGNFLTFFTTNNPKGFDEALRSRFGVTYTIDPFTNAQTHREYFATLAPGLSESEQSSLAAASFTGGLRGRDLSAVITMANAAVARTPSNEEIRNKRMLMPAQLPAISNYETAIAARIAARGK